MLEKYKVVFFDAGGTLLHPHPSVGEVYHDVAIQYGYRTKPEELENLFRQAWLKRDGLTHLASPASPAGGHSSEKVERDWWKALVHEVFSAVGGGTDFEAFFAELYDKFARPEVWRLYPGTLEILAELKKRKKRLAIISNWDSRLFGICKSLELEEHFEFILASAVFGASKPSPKIFEEALRRMGARASEAVHIGDSFEDDIKGAGTVGMDAILIERNPKHRKLEQVRVIHDLCELLETRASH